MRTLSRSISALLVLSLCWGGMLQSAQAGIIGTPEVVQTEQAALAPVQARAQLTAAMQRADVRQALQAKGVDLAQARVDALSDEEAQWMAQRIDSAPAGASDLVGTIVFIFVLLLITDILGLTKVFPFTRSAR
jgi:hypothetical protein